MSAISIYERMMKRVKRNNSGCLIYVGSKDGGGYGTVSTKRGSAPAKAHRISYEFHFGEIPSGMVICHSCDTPSCVEPSHLRAATQKENVADMIKRRRRNPVSDLNLRPGKAGFHGAGPISIKEMKNGTR